MTYTHAQYAQRPMCMNVVWTQNIFYFFCVWLRRVACAWSFTYLWNHYFCVFWCCCCLGCVCVRVRMYSCPLQRAKANKPKTKNSECMHISILVICFHVDHVLLHEHEGNIFASNSEGSNPWALPRVAYTSGHDTTSQQQSLGYCWRREQNSDISETYCLMRINFLFNS